MQPARDVPRCGADPGGVQVVQPLCPRRPCSERGPMTPDPGWSLDVLGPDDDDRASKAGR
jgi:hypothetical protein